MQQLSENNKESELDKEWIPVDLLEVKSVLAIGGLYWMTEQAKEALRKALNQAKKRKEEDSDLIKRYESKYKFRWLPPNYCHSYGNMDTLDRAKRANWDNFRAKIADWNNFRTLLPLPPDTFTYIRNTATTAKTLGEGAFGCVYPVTIDPAHQQFQDGSRTSYAVKQFYHDSESRQAFQREVINNKQIARFPHKGITASILSWTMDGECYILYPAAECDLGTFMSSRAPPRVIDESTTLWFFRRLKDLSDAISHIHMPRSLQPKAESPAIDSNNELFIGCHHDLKPENILVFADEVSGNLTFKLSDFGSASFVPWSDDDDHSTSPHRGTVMYEAPEVLSRGKDSRPYDLWSLGCIMLELLLWLVGTNEEDGQVAFSTRREHDISDQLPTDDAFWYKKGSNILLKPAVHAHLDELEQVHCSRYPLLRPIPSVIRALLVIDPTKRLSASELSDQLHDAIEEIESLLSNGSASSLGPSLTDLTLMPPPDDPDKDGHQNRLPTESRLVVPTEFHLSSTNSAETQIGIPNTKHSRRGSDRNSLRRSRRSRNSRRTRKCEESAVAGAISTEGHNIHVQDDSARYKTVTESKLAADELGPHASDAQEESTCHPQEAHLMDMTSSTLLPISAFPQIQSASREPEAHQRRLDEMERKIYLDLDGVGAFTISQYNSLQSHEHLVTSPWLSFDTLYEMVLILKRQMRVARAIRKNTLFFYETRSDARFSLIVRETNRAKVARVIPVSEEMLKLYLGLLRSVFAAAKLLKTTNTTFLDNNAVEAIFAPLRGFCFTFAEYLHLDTKHVVFPKDCDSVAHVSLHLSAALLQILALGVTSSVKSHTSSFVRSASPRLQEACSIQVGSNIKIALKKQRLACLDTFVGGPIWVFQGIDQTDPGAGLYISTYLSDFAELWGLARVRYATPQKAAAIEIDTLGGTIRSIGDVRTPSSAPECLEDEVLCHWFGWDSEAGPAMPFDPLKRLVIGFPLPENTSCDIKRQYYVRTLPDRDLGTSSAGYKTDARTFTSGFMQYVGLSVGLTQKFTASCSTKNVILDSWLKGRANNPNFIPEIAALDQLVGLEISKCNGNAVRVTLWDILRHPEVMAYAQRLEGDLSCCSKWTSFETFQSLYDSITTKVARWHLFDTVTNLIDRLKCTGVNDRGELLAWNVTCNGGCCGKVLVPGWVTMVKESRVCSTFAILSNRCLTVEGRRTCLNDCSDEDLPEQAASLVTKLEIAAEIDLVKYTKARKRRPGLVLNTPKKRHRGNESSEKDTDSLRKYHSRRQRGRPSSGTGGIYEFISTSEEQLRKTNGLLPQNSQHDRPRPSSFVPPADSWFSEDRPDIKAVEASLARFKVSEDLGQSENDRPSKVESVLPRSQVPTIGQRHNGSSSPHKRRRRTGSMLSVKGTRTGHSEASEHRSYKHVLRRVDLAALKWKLEENHGILTLTHDSRSRGVVFRSRQGDIPVETTLKKYNVLVQKGDEMINRFDVKLEEAKDILIFGYPRARFKFRFQEVKYPWKPLRPCETVKSIRVLDSRYCQPQTYI
ncbi:hypothetical protein PV08_03980 [Exophiala spinifera]|uniref:non-specific serine/threonine protein kinase n=1 Tax=Exophiala spinifera TaxID=91928 RepID=A0A0D2BDV4_9EURO|nr:uncharacterized protein PV08_03980 [Exophiala spinifera]KIW16790.1 hypothetical protein PV08_03980 [Exophiala spinifera]